jgi:hypothetical protein
MSGRKRLLGRTKFRWEDNSEVDAGAIGMDFSGLGSGAT